MIYVVGQLKDSTAFFDFPENAGRVRFLADEIHRGENIDELNPWYCELTGLYYLWKNDDSSVIGLEHYRTYFADPETLQPLDPNKIDWKNKIMVSGVSFPFFRRKNPLDQLPFDDPKTELPATLELIGAYGAQLGQNFPEFCSRYIRNTGGMVICNAFIAERSAMNSWFEFIFPLLKELSGRIGLGKNNLRLLGYVSEVLFGAWVNWKVSQHSLEKVNGCLVKRMTNSQLLSSSDDIREVRYIFRGEDQPAELSTVLKNKTISTRILK